MMLHNINNNILISYPYFLGVYQDKYEKLELYQEIQIFLGWNQNKTPEETVVHVSNSIIIIGKKLSMTFLKGGWASSDYG